MSRPKYLTKPNSYFINNSEQISKIISQDVKSFKLEY